MEFSREHPSEWSFFRDEMSSATIALMRGFLRQDRHLVSRAWTASGTALAHLPGVMTPALAQSLSALAPLAARISGSGGGDCAVGLAWGDAAATAAAKRVRKAGFVAFVQRISPHGKTIAGLAA